MTHSTWNWLPPPDPGIWRYSAAWARGLVAAAPYLALAAILATLAFADGRFTAASGVAVEVPSARASQTEAEACELIALVVPMARQSGGGEELFLYFEDVRYTLEDPASADRFRSVLAERRAATKAGSLLLLADQRVMTGELLQLVDAVRAAGVSTVRIARRRD